MPTWIRKDNDKAENWDYVDNNGIRHGLVARLFNGFLFKPFSMNGSPIFGTGLLELNDAKKIIERDYSSRNPVTQRFIRTTDKFTTNPPGWNKYAFTVHLCNGKKSMTSMEIREAHLKYSHDFIEECMTDGDIAIALIMAIENGAISVVNGEI